LHLDDVHELVGIELPEGPYNTFAGFVVSQLGHIPTVGDSVEALGHRFTVTELDGRRIARVRVAATDSPSAASAG
jgi:putative hemolysin